MLVEVLRPLNQGKIPAGSVVDASGWLNLPLLLTDGTVRPAPAKGHNEEVQTLRRRVQELEQQVSELEGRLARAGKSKGKE